MVLARHSSPRPPSAPSRSSPPRLPFAPALAPAGFPGGLPGPAASTPRAPRYPDVSAFTGGVPETASTPRTATAPPLGRHRTGSTTPSGSTRRAPAPAATDRRDPREPRRPSAPRPPRSAPTTSTTSTTSALTGRVAVAAVAVGALATAGHSLVDLAASDPSTTELAAGSLALASASASGDTAVARQAESEPPRAGAGIDAATADVLAVPAASQRGDGGTDHVASLTKGKKRTEEAVARAEAAKAPQFVKPAQGRFTSGFGARWGSSHKGVDVAGPIGTPIVAVADGVVSEAGPASGFGQWVKLRHEDGTETVYGHVNRYFVSEGDTVKAGEEIAEIGNKGQSTGPHLHFEVHTPGGSKINPLPWLSERGISLGAQKD